MIYPQDQRIHDQRNHDRIDQFRHNDPAQIIRELKITFQKEHQKIDHDPIQKLTQCDQEQRKFDILIKEKLLKQAIGPLIKPKAAVTISSRFGLIPANSR